MEFLSNWREFRIFQQQQNHLVSSFLIAQKTKSLKRLIIKNAIRVSPMGIVISLLWRSNFLSDLHRNHLKLPICRYTSFWSSQLFASVLKSSMAHFMLLNREGSRALKNSVQSKHNHIPRVSIYEIVVHNFSKRAILIHRNLFIISLNIGDFPHFLPSLSLCAAFFIVQTLRIQFSSVAMCLKF